jgi:hypothetical protein
MTVFRSLRSVFLADLLASVALAQATVRITGQVNDPVNRPFANIDVALKVPGSNEIVAATKTDQNGKFILIFDGERPRTYDVHFRSPDYRQLVKTVDAAADLELAPIQMKPGVCGATDFQPTCTIFGIVIFTVAVVALCLITIIGMLLFRRRLEPLLIRSGVLVVLSPLSIFVPLTVMGRSLNKLSGAMVVMMMFPFAAMLLFVGIGCFLAWATQTTYRAFRRESVAREGLRS